MKLIAWVPTLPDPATRAALDTLASTLPADQQQVAANLAAQKAAMEQANAAVNTKLSQLDQVAAQLTPFQQAAAAEHEALRQAVADTRTAEQADHAAQAARLDQLAAAQTSTAAGIASANATALQARDTAADAASRAASARSEAATATGTANTATAAVTALTARLVALEAANAALAAQVTALAARQTVERLGRVAVPLLALNASVDLPITWDTPMPSATYDIRTSPDTAILGKVTVTVKSQTAAGCVLTVKAVLAVALGSGVLALAHTLA